MIASIFTRTLPRYLLCMALFAFPDRVSFCAQKVVVDDADFARINAARADILEHVRAVSLSSSLGPYFDCDGYREMVKLDNKVIPVVLRDLVRMENSRILYGKAQFEPRPKDNEEWLQRARQAQQEIAAGTLPWFISVSVLAGTSFGKAARATGFDGTDDIYQWVKWWKENRGLYALTFHDSDRFDVGDLTRGKDWPHMSCRMTDGLLDVRAVSATFKNIIENAAAEAGVKVALGDDGRKSSYIGGSVNVITSIDYRQMTFDEFAYAIAEQISFGYPRRKEGDTYYFGTGDPAPGRWMVGNRSNDLICDIKMDRTVFRTGERMPLGISLRYLVTNPAGIEILAGAPAEEYPVFVVQVLDADGKMLPTARTDRIENGSLKTARLGGAGNASQWVGEIDLARLFDFQKPGDYTVTVTYKLGPDKDVAMQGKPLWYGQTASVAVFVKIIN